MLGGPTTIISPSKLISHNKSMNMQIQDKQAWRSKISQPSIEICIQRIFLNPRSALLRNYAPVASFITVRLLFASTSIPNFKVLQYDVFVAFVQNKLDSNHPPVYCECAKGYEDRRKYVYRLYRHLYGMIGCPRGWGQLFACICADFGLTRVKSDESVFSSSNSSTSQRVESKTNI